VRYLSIANGSLAEIETHVELSRRLRYIDEGCEAILLDKAARVGMMLNRLIASIREP
jgi:four helix bundle protein